MIAGIQIAHLEARLAERQLALVLTDAALDRIGEAGFDPVYGARPLRREIQQRLENPLAQKILGGEYLPGDTVFVDVRGDELAFTNGEETPAVAMVH